MRPALVLLLAAGLAAAAPVPKGVKKKSDAELLEGRWVRVSLDVGSGPKPDTSRWMVVEGGTISAGDTDGKDPIEATFTLDPTRSPKQIDVKWKHFNRPQSYIYELDGDTLTWCHAQDSQPRPTEFKGSTDGRVCVVYKRVKE
jgi:uncharacterized protein (TIGR03067 family)